MHISLILGIVSAFLAGWLPAQPAIAKQAKKISILGLGIAAPLLYSEISRFTVNQLNFDLLAGGIWLVGINAILTIAIVLSLYALGIAIAKPKSSTLSLPTLADLLPSFETSIFKARNDLNTLLAYELANLYEYTSCYYVLNQNLANSATFLTQLNRHAPTGSHVLVLHNEPEDGKIYTNNLAGLIYMEDWVNRSLGQIPKLQRILNIAPWSTGQHARLRLIKHDMGLGLLVTDTAQVIGSIDLAKLNKTLTDIEGEYSIAIDCPLALLGLLVKPEHLTKIALIQNHPLVKMLGIRTLAGYLQCVKGDYLDTGETIFDSYAGIKFKLTETGSKVYCLSI